MPRLTLRTLLAYIDDTLGPVETRSLGRKVADSAEARELVERIKKVTRRRGLRTPVPTDEDETADPNTVAEYLDNTLDSVTLKQVEETCLTSDVHLAEVAACHQILTLVLTEPVRVPPMAHRRMYGLQTAPGATSDRCPNKSLPIGGVCLPELVQTELDEADAALLLGLNRYSAETSWAARLTLVSVGAALLAFLAIAVYMAIPSRTPKAPETTPGHSFAQLPNPASETPKPKDIGAPKKPKAPEVMAPKPKEVDVRAVVGELATAVVSEFAATKPIDPGPALGDPAAAPNAKGRDPIGTVETKRVLVLTKSPQAPGDWSRLRFKEEDDEPIHANSPVMALPGYKANLLIGERDKQVQVVLWGNVPEQLPYRVFESRVTFHPPAKGFDADVTLLAGRVYLRSKTLGVDKNLTGAKVRVRVANEVWDVALPDGQAEVLVELVSWFEPGTAYARKEGKEPKREVRFAVVAGAAGFVAPRRFKTINTVAVNTQIKWDSSSGTLSDPEAIENLQESLLTPVLDGNTQRNIARVLSETADKVTERTATGPILKARLDPEPTAPDRDLTARLAVFSQAALADSTAGGDWLKPLVDVLKSELAWPARQAAVTALTNWVSRDRGNTALLHVVLLDKGLEEDAADRLLWLLRGFVSPTKPDQDRLDLLGKWLADAAIPVREAALWNIVAVEQEAWVPLPVPINVGVVNNDEYNTFLRAWRAKLETLKNRQRAPLPVP